jgi:hypothetical protein
MTLFYNKSEVNFMIIDGHVKFRFVQRIMDIKDEREVNRFIANNEYEVTHRINEFINDAELLIKDYAPTRKDTLDYYVNDEVLVIIDPRNDELKTMYFITLDTDDKNNSLKIKQYVKKIRKNNNKVKDLKIKQKKQNKITDHYTFMLQYLTDEINTDLVNKIRNDEQKSIDICKELAAQENSLRNENRVLMTEMFKKIILK